MNDVGISSQPDIHGWTGELTFTQLLVSYWIAYRLNIIMKFSLHDALRQVLTFKLNEHL